MAHHAYLLQAIRTFDTTCHQDAIAHVQRTVDHVMTCIADAAACTTRADAQSTITAEALTRAARAVLVPRVARKLTPYLTKYRNGELALRFTGMMTLLRQRVGSLHLSQKCGNVMRAALHAALWTVLGDARAAMRARKGVSITVNDVRNSVRKHGPIVAPAPKAAPAKRKRAASPKRKRAASPKRKRAASPKRKRAASPKRKRAASPKRTRAASPKRRRSIRTRAASLSTKRATRATSSTSRGPRMTRASARRSSPTAPAPRVQPPGRTFRNPFEWEAAEQANTSSASSPARKPPRERKPRPWVLPPGYTLASGVLKQGGHGEIAAVKHRGKTYIAKRGIYKKRKNAKERKYALRAAELGVGPKIVYHDDALMIMERLEETLQAHMIRTTPNGNRFRFRAMTTAEMDEIVALFETCLHDGWQHNDASIVNIMWDKGKFYLVDFGESKPWTPPKGATGKAAREAAIHKQALTSLGWIPNLYTPRPFIEAIDDYAEARGHLTTNRKAKYRREGQLAKVLKLHK